MPRSPLVQFAAGLVFGAFTSFIAVEVGLIFGAGLILIVGFVGVLGAKPAFLSGTLIGQGATLLALVASTGRDAPLFLEVIGAFLLVGGLILGLIVAYESVRRR
jgi:hypothetical protein